ncbi:MAG: UDP-N-acetylmuramoyl-tripeptide--D-alanyl-D-alanine ligase [Chlamydiia bacterium]|nr:UDP-N-acetylmuramoyl-tripeptide--D-alanyl-D-alanine ligase [Chlamydiia bacterium]
MRISLEKIAAILGSVSASTLDIHHYVIDSRKAVQGSLFFALKGARADGHDYLHEVSEKGAYAAVVSREYTGPGYGLELFFVEDVLEALQKLARVMLKERGIKVIGVTGSVGKTTTKDMIARILRLKYKVHATKRSYNSQSMLPITILEADGDEDFMVLEMAMSKAGHIKQLVSIAPPAIVVLTPITYCHSENFETLEEIAAAKAEIFCMSTEYAVLHIDSAKFKAVYSACLSSNVLYPAKIPLISPFKESHFSDNFIAAYEVAKYVGMSDDEIRIASLSMHGSKSEHRFERIEKNGIVFIDDSYNANVLSVCAALDNIPQPSKEGRKIFVFGEMKELGSVAAMSHKMVTTKALEKVDVVLAIGKATKEMVECFESAGKIAYYHYDYRALKDKLFKVVKKGDVVLIKGSNSHKLWKLLEGIPLLQE